MKLEKKPFTPHRRNTSHDEDEDEDDDEEHINCNYTYGV
jgi:hypothetical protein